MRLAPTIAATALAGAALAGACGDDGSAGTATTTSAATEPPRRYPLPCNTSS